MDVNPTEKTIHMGKCKVKQTTIKYRPEDSKKTIVLKVYKKLPDKKQVENLPDETA